MKKKVNKYMLRFVLENLFSSFFSDMKNVEKTDQ